MFVRDYSKHFTLNPHNSGIGTIISDEKTYTEITDLPVIY